MRYFEVNTGGKCTKGQDLQFPQQYQSQQGMQFYKINRLPRNG